MNLILPANPNQLRLEPSKEVHTHHLSLSFPRAQVLGGHLPPKTCLCHRCDQNWIIKSSRPYFLPQKWPPHLDLSESCGCPNASTSLSASSAAPGRHLMREVLRASVEPARLLKISSHSLKRTPLSWASKAGLSEESRHVLDATSPRLWRCTGTWC